MNEVRLWRIWSMEHGAYWRQNRHGYTNRIEEAGLYKEEDALLIVREGNEYLAPDEPPNEAMILAEAYEARD